MRRPGSMLRHRLDTQTRGVEPNSGRRREATRGGGHARRCDSARFRVRSQESGVGHGGGGARWRRRAAAGVKEDEAATIVIAPSGSAGPRSEAAGSGGAHGPEKRSGGARAGSRVEPRRRRHMRAEWSEDDRRHCGRGEGGRGTEPGPRAREAGRRGAGRAPGSTRAAAPRAGRAERRRSPHRGGGARPPLRWSQPNDGVVAEVQPASEHEGRRGG